RYRFVTEFLGQPDHDSLRAADEAEPVLVLVLRDLVYQGRAEGAELSERLIKVVDEEHDAAHAQHVRRHILGAEPDRGGRMELGELDLTMAVRRPHHGDVGTEVLEPDDAICPRALYCRLSYDRHAPCRDAPLRG